MDFDFMPYRLNADISDFKDNIKYISSDNGVDLYKARKGLIKPIIDFQVVDTNLYFFEGSLITVYIQLSEKADNIIKVKEALDKALFKNSKIIEIDSGLLYYWQSNSYFLGLLIKKQGKFVTLYQSINKFNIFNP